MKFLSLMLASLTITHALVATDARCGNEQMDGTNPYEIHRESAIMAAAGTPWSCTRQVLLVNKATEVSDALLSNSTGKKYPISEDDLQELYNQANSDKVYFFAYSSLIDRESSAAKAISPEGLATHTPAIAFGIQRTFNREMAPEVAANFGDLKKPNDVAILNVFEKKNHKKLSTQEAIVNGVLLHLSASDLHILAKREVGYDLIPVLVARWNEAVDPLNDEPEIFLAYTFRAPDYQGEGTRFTSYAINPIPGYVNYLQKGLKEMGTDFEAMWWATTYLADKKTPLGELVNRPNWKPYRKVNWQHRGGETKKYRERNHRGRQRCAEKKTNYTLTKE